MYTAQISIPKCEVKSGWWEKEEERSNENKLRNKVACSLT